MNKWLFHFRTPVGVVWIAPHPQQPGRVLLGFRNQVLGPYPSPKSAAGDVHLGHSGSTELDDYATTNYAIPEDVSEWEQGDLE